jgi:hypothetical protein
MAPSVAKLVGLVDATALMGREAIRRLPPKILISCLFFAGCFCPQAASAVTLTDNYWGGLNTYDPANGDIIGPASEFDVTQADVTRVGPGGNTLKVVIHTAFAGLAGTPDVAGTGYGALFLMPGADWHPTGSAADHYGSDTYVPGEWKYAFAIPQAPGPGSQAGSYLAGSTVGGLFALKSDGSDVLRSNVNGDFVTYPYPGNPGYYFRQGEAVQYIADGSTKSIFGGQWAVDAPASTITFLIDDNNFLGNDLALSWAMTCANDVIQGQVSLPSAVPLPPTFGLFLTGLGGMGAFGRWRKRRSNDFTIKRLTPSVA